MMKTEILIATYNKPKYLWLCLQSIMGQDVLPDGICLADDGSGQETRDLVERFREQFPDMPLRHSWHDDRGFRKSAALNQAIAGSEADYLIFLDDDVILSPGFIARHIACARPGRFLTGSLIRLDAAFSQTLLGAQHFAWSNGRLAGWVPKTRSQWLKAMPFPMSIMALFDRLSPVAANFQGACASGWRKDFIAVNGFNADMAYGGLDKELGVRLHNAGVKGVHVRYTAPVYHIDHGREYANATVKSENRKRIEAARRNKTMRADNGIERL